MSDYNSASNSKVNKYNVYNKRPGTGRTFLLCRTAPELIRTTKRKRTAWKTRMKSTRLGILSSRLLQLQEGSVNGKEAPAAKKTEAALRKKSRRDLFSVRHVTKHSSANTTWRYTTGGTWGRSRSSVTNVENAITGKRICRSTRQGTASAGRIWWDHIHWVLRWTHQMVCEGIQLFPDESLNPNIFFGLDVFLFQVSSEL